jgi:hypothetical protein
MFWVHSYTEDSADKVISHMRSVRFEGASGHIAYSQNSVRTERGMFYVQWVRSNMSEVEVVRPRE